MTGVTGVILAGGRGVRMGALGKRFAKALLPIGNEPVIHHQLRMLADLGVERVHIVTGERTAGLAAALGDGPATGLRIELVDQGPSLGSAHALSRLRGVVDEPFLLLLGDYWFLPVEPVRMLRRLEVGESAIAIKAETDPALTRAACAVYLDGDSRVTRLVEKPARPAAGAWKGCGFYALQPEIFDAVASTPRTALRDEYELTVSLDIFLRGGAAVFGETVIAHDTNLTRPEDLLGCNVAWLRRTHHESLVAANALVDPGVTLRNVVIGDHAAVQGSGHVDHAVVLPGARLHVNGSIRGVIVTPDETIVVPRENSP